MRESVSRGEFEWTVVNEPSWPVFMAWSMSRASPPRTSPTTMRSGRIRRALRTRSRIFTSPRPSMFGGRDSSGSTCCWWSWSSFASSTVTMRSSSGMKLDSTFSSVVFPVPVPPLTTTVQATAHAAVHEVRDLRRERPEADEVVDLERLLGELPDGHERPADGERMHDHVHAGAVGEAGVDHRVRLVDPAADLADDLVDDAADVRRRRRTCTSVISMRPARST